VPEFRLRAATTNDLASCHRVWLATEPTPTATVPPLGPPSVLPLHRHELDTGRLVVAELDGVIVGFGATLTRSGVAYVADLFVAPEHQSRGIGARLLHALLDDHDGPRFTLASTDPRARALYERFGMHPVCEYAYLRAHPDDVSHDRLDQAGVVLEVTALIDEIVDIDRAVTGRDRRVDLVHAEARLGARTWRARRDSRTVGYAQIVHPIWWSPTNPDAVRIGPIIATEPRELLPILAAVVAEAASLQTTSLGPFVPVGGPVYAAMISAGFVDDDRDLLMVSDPSLVDVDRYLPAVDTA
jgi:ribosomal protein S18 acetylase RimI-like enzyme